MILNITYQGHSTDYNLGDVDLSDDDIHRVAEELTNHKFDGFVIDRIATTIYLRPKVPFGSEGGAA